MEEIVKEIMLYHRLGISCLAGMILAVAVSVYSYQKMNMKNVLEYFWRKRRRYLTKSLLLVGIVMVCGRSIPAAASQIDGTTEEVEQPEEQTDDICPVLEVTYKDEKGQLLILNEERNELLPYYNPAKEVTVEFKVTEEFPDEEKSFIKIISKDRNLKWLRNIESEEETEWISYIVTEADCILLTGYDYAYSFGHWTRSGEDNEPVIEWVDPKTDEKIHLDLEQLIAMVRENKDMDPNPYGSKNYLTYYIPLEESKRLIVIDERHAFYLKYADIDTVDGKDGISLNGWFLTKES